MQKVNRIWSKLNSTVSMATTPLLRNACERVPHPKRWETSRSSPLSRLFLYCLNLSPAQKGSIARVVRLPPRALPSVPDLPPCEQHIACHALAHTQHFLARVAQVVSILKNSSSLARHDFRLSHRCLTHPILLFSLALRPCCSLHMEMYTVIRYLEHSLICRTTSLYR